MELEAKIIQVLQPQSGTSASGKAWSKIGFVVETGGQYPKKAYFEVFGQDKYSAMPLQVGLDVKISFDIEAHEYNGRWFNSVNAWRVEQAYPQPNPQQQVFQQPQQPQQAYQPMAAPQPIPQQQQQPQPQHPQSAPGQLPF